MTLAFHFTAIKDPNLLVLIKVMNHALLKWFSPPPFYFDLVNSRGDEKALDWSGHIWSLLKLFMVIFLPQALYFGQPDATLSGPIS